MAKVSSSGNPTLIDILESDDADWDSIRAAIRQNGRGSLIAGRQMAATTNAGILKALKGHAAAKSRPRESSGNVTTGTGGRDGEDRNGSSHITDDKRTSTASTVDCSDSDEDGRRATTDSTTNGEEDDLRSTDNLDAGTPRMPRRVDPIDDDRRPAIDCISEQTRRRAVPQRGLVRGTSSRRALGQSFKSSLKIVGEDKEQGIDDSLNFEELDGSESRGEKSRRLTEESGSKSSGSESRGDAGRRRSRRAQRHGRFGSMQGGFNDSVNVMDFGVSITHLHDDSSTRSLDLSSEDQSSNDLHGSCSSSLLDSDGFLAWANGDSVSKLESSLTRCQYNPIRTITRPKGRRRELADSDATNLSLMVDSEGFLGWNLDDSNKSDNSHEAASKDDADTDTADTESRDRLECSWRIEDMERPADAGDEVGDLPRSISGGGFVSAQMRRLSSKIAERRESWATVDSAKDAEVSTVDVKKVLLKGMSRDDVNANGQAREIRRPSRRTSNFALFRRDSDDSSSAQSNSGNNSDFDRAAIMVRGSTQFTGVNIMEMRKEILSGGAPDGYSSRDGERGGGVKETLLENLRKEILAGGDAPDGERSGSGKLNMGFF